MKLYQVPNNSYIKILKDAKAPPGARPVNKDEIIHFHHIDGMYSFCYDSNKQIVHVPAWQEVEIVDKL